MSKVGLLTKEEGSFFAKIIANEIPVKGIWKTGIKLVLPILINSLDDKVGDKVPGPWQKHIEDLTTSIYVAMQDGKIDETEQSEIVALCTKVMNENIDIPLIGEDEEEMIFLFLLKFVAGMVRKGLSKK